MSMGASGSAPTPQDYLEVSLLRSAINAVAISLTGDRSSDPDATDFGFLPKWTWTAFELVPALAQKLAHVSANC